MQVMTSVMMRVMKLALLLQHLKTLLSTLLCMFVLITQIEGSDDIEHLPCSVCKEGQPGSLPGKFVAIPGFPGQYTCAQLDILLPALLPNSTNPNCQLIQSVGSICGCPMPSPSCSLCLDASSMAFPDRTLDFLSDLFGGFVPTCELLDAYLRSTPPDDTLCTVGRQYLSDYCGCNGSDLRIERPCSVCSDGLTKVTFPDQELVLDGVPFQNCKQLEEAASVLFSEESQECAVFQSISPLCGCPPVQADPCSMCPNGGEMAYPEKPVRFVKDSFGGLEPTCRIFDAYTKSLPSNSQECSLIQLMSGYCGCPPISENHCEICDNGEELKPEFEQHVLPDSITKYLNIPDNLGFDITCEMVVSVQFQLEADDAMCTTARSRRELCGCEQGEYYYLKASEPWHKVLLAWLPRTSGILSLVGASCIIFHVLQDRKSRSQVYNQVVASMSTFDVIGSIAWIVSTAANDTDDLFPVYGEVGNEKTCIAQGFFLELAVTSIMYNTSLSAYYFLSIARGWRGTKLKRTSKYLHAIPCIVGFTLAFVGIPYYHTNFIVCHLAPVPLADSYAPLTWLLFAPVWTAISICTILSFCVWWKVRKQAAAASRWRFRTGRRTPSAEGAAGQQSSSSSGISSGTSSGSPDHASSSPTVLLSSRLAPESNVPQRSVTGEDGDIAGSRFRIIYIPSFFRRNRRPPDTKMKRLEREVMWQALTYVFSMCICWTIFVSLFYKQDVSSQSFALYCVGSLLMPLQGFLNCLTYFRPRMARLRRKRLREGRRLQRQGVRKGIVRGLLDKMVGRSLPADIEDSPQGNPALDDPAQSSGCDSSSGLPSRSISSAEAITLEVDNVAEPAAYFCEYEDEAALSTARKNIAEELKELDQAEGLIEPYEGSL